MGWRLAVEVLDHCPDLKYRPFRVLVALALDARDETRQGMPGLELLTLRGNCGMRTTKRAMRELTAAGLVKVVKSSAPGRRTVYEILPMAVDNPPTGDNMLSPERGTEPKQRGTKTRPTGDTNDGPVSVSISSHKSESSLSSAERAAQRLLDLGGTEREIRHIVDKIMKDPKIRYAGPYLTAAIDRGDGPVLLAQARQGIAEDEAMRRMFGERRARQAEDEQKRAEAQARRSAPQPPRDPERVGAIVADLRATLTSPVPPERAPVTPAREPSDDTGRPSPRTAEETAAEAQRQADGLNEWMRQNPGATS